MTTIPEEAVKAAINAWFEETRPHVMNTTPLPEQARRMRLAITAALPFLQRVEALDWAAKIADELEERTKLKYMSPDGEECQIVPLTVIIEAAKALRALPFLPVQGAGVSADARQALDRFSFAAQQWGWQADQGSNDAIINDAKAEFDASYAALERILSALEPSAARELALEEAAKIADNGNAGWLKKRDITANKKEARDYETMAIACSHVAAAIRALSSPDHADAGKVEGDGWLPIESAPKDGTEIIYLTKYGSIGFCRYAVDDINDWFGWWDLQADDEVYPKFWLSRSTLPSAPSEGAE